MNKPKEIYDCKLITQYADIMKEIKIRSQYIKMIFDKASFTDRIPLEMETCALQIRKIAELIVLSSLLLNETELKKHYKNMQNWWSAKLIFRDVRRVNPYFFPKANMLTAKIGRPHLTHQTFEYLYDQSCKLIHASNPLLTQPDQQDFRAQIDIWLEGIINLLDHHMTILYRDGNVMIIDASVKFGTDEMPVIKLFESDIPVDEVNA